MKKKLALILSVILLTTAVMPMALNVSAANAAPNVLPAIREWTGGTGNFTPNASTVLVNASGVDKQIDMVAQFFQEMAGLDLEVKTSGSSNAIVFTLDTSLKGKVGDEGYTINATSSKIDIKAPTKIGLLYGGISVVQSVYADGYFPCGTATDYPAYAIRSGMVDVGRAYVPMEELNKITRYMAWYKMNEIHVHLNDVGYYNYLTFRLESDIPGLTTTDGHYTKEEYRQYQKDMLDYGVTVISEIDTPAHAGAFSLITGEDKITMLDSRPTNCLDLTDPNVTRVVKKLFTEMLGGDDPVIIGDTIHIGMDEYPDEYKTQMETYCNEIIAHVNSLGYKARIWSGVGADGGCLYGAELKGDFEVNFWAINLSGISETMALNCGVINTINNLLYVVPSTNYNFVDYYDVEKLYSNWQVHTVDYYGTKLCEANDSRLLGACYALWNDIHTGYFGLTYRDIIDRLRGMTCLIAEKTWCGTDTVSKISTANFMARYNTLSHRGGDSDLFNTDLPDEGVKLDFTSSVAPSYATYNGTVSGGSFKLDGTSYISMTPKAVGFPNSLSFELTLSEYPAQKTALFGGYESIGSEVFIDTDGTIGFKSEISETDCYNFTFDYKIPLNQTVKLCLTSGIKNTRLIVNDSLAFETINDKQHMVYDSLQPRRWSTFVIPLEKIGYGIKGKIDDIEILETETELGELQANANLAYGKTVTVSGTETSDGSLGPALAVDGDESTRLSLARDKDEQWMVVDLGDTYTVRRVEIAFKSRVSAYQILVSADNKNYTKVYEVSGLEDYISATDDIILETPANARYVKFLQLDRYTVPDYPGWGEYSAGINEFRVFSFNKQFYTDAIAQARDYANTLPDGDVTRESILEAATALEEYINSEAIYQANVDRLYYELQSAVSGVDDNVAREKSYTVSGSGVGFGSYTANLTDGVASDTEEFNSEWFGLYKGTSDGINTVNGVGTIVVDLESVYDITRVRAHFRNANDSGVGAPTKVTVSVSDDGETFTKAGNLTIDTAENSIYWAELYGSAKGRYVQFDVELGNTFAFLNEIEVYGTESDTSGDTSGDTSDESSDPFPPNPDLDPDPDPDPDIVKGDINGNEEIDAVDYTLLKRMYFGTYDVSDITVGDINNNEEIDAVDYTLLKRIYFGTYVIN